jgi:hypothetical protein
MYVLIDPSPSDSVRLYVARHDDWEVGDYPLSRTKDFLAAFRSALQGVPLINLKGVGVLVGKGRFTSTRVATTIANVLAFSLRIPVLTCTEPPDQQTKPAELFATEGVRAIRPVYSSAPRIGGVVSV